MYKKLKALRYKNKLTTKQMGDKLGISKPFYCQLENCTRRLSYDMAIKISAVFHVKPDHLFYQDHKDSH
ncbi:MAG: helix-turn-helix transcriptional regulator [Bacilli bacterium]